MGACREDELGLLEVVGQIFAFFSREDVFKSRHILVLFMLDVLMEVLQEGGEKREEVLAVRGHVLQFVEVFLYLVTVSNGMILLHDDTHCHMLLAV